MPCWSVIQTTFTNAKALTDAILEAGGEIMASSETRIQVRWPDKSWTDFSRRTTTGAFSATGDVDRVPGLRKGYAAAEVKRWAQANKWGYIRKGDKITLKKYG